MKHAIPAADVLACSPSDACRRLGIGKTTLFALIRDGHLRTFKVGTRTLIPDADLRRFMAERLEMAA